MRRTAGIFGLGAVDAAVAFIPIRVTSRKPSCNRKRSKGAVPIFYTITDWLRLALAAVISGAAIYFFITAVRRRIANIRLGTAVEFVHRRGFKKKRTGFVQEVLGHRRLMNDLKSGLMHALFFYGFIMLQFGALDLIWKRLSGGRPIPYPLYPYFSLVQEITVAIILLTVCYAAYRRYGEKLERLKRGKKPSIVLWLIGSLMVTVYLTLAFEHLVYSNASYSTIILAPFSSLLADGFVAIGMQSGSLAASVGLEVAWWLHLLLLLIFLVYVPQSKHFHLLTAPVNIWFRRGEEAKKLTPLDLENEKAEQFGVGAIEHFNQKQLLDLYACVECGRCTNMCPASNTGKMLSPMHLLTKLRDHLTDKGEALTSKSPWIPMGLLGKRTEGAYAVGAVIPSDLETDGIAATMQMQETGWNRQSSLSSEEIALIGNVITEEELWSCTTCRNCEEQCPAGNEHVDKIIDMRRHLVLMEGKLPSEGQRALSNIERQGNPWGLPRTDRAEWMEECLKQTGIRIRTVKEMSVIGEKPEIVLWAGSMGAYDSRSRKVLYSLVQLLDAAGLSFATLGNEERSSGDTARRMGNELLFQELCHDNINTINKYGIRHIVTACPHTYHIFKNEYPDFGLSPEIVLEHHSELLATLIANGKLQATGEIHETVTIHDSCYMGRYNDSYDAPRTVLNAIPGLTVKEMERSGSNAMCCGAGGGMMWIEETAGTRINYARTRQALDVSPSIISSSCPYCLTMMEDGLKAMQEEEGRTAAKDIAELLAASVCQSRNKKQNAG